ncbi:MAG: hypothetical protein ACT4OQ_00220, partial [Chloroflexota bacterium]
GVSRSRSAGHPAYSCYVTNTWRNVLLALSGAILLLSACGSSDAARSTVSASSSVASTAPATIPTVSDCPAEPTLADVIAVEAKHRPQCFGSDDLTLRGWVFQELDPAYDCVSMSDRPMWLTCILSRQRLVADEIAPAPWSPAIASLFVASDPAGAVGTIGFGASEGPVAVNTWIEVTGHFDDPAAEACGPPGSPERIECDGTLVLTSVERLDAVADVLEPDTIAMATADGIRVRAEPDRHGDQVATIDAGTRVFVISGPASDRSDAALEWWLVGPYACEGGCGYEPRIGWVSTGPEGTWLDRVSVNCLDSYEARDAERFAFAPELLACHGSDPITLEGIIDYWCCSPLILAPTEPAWLAGASTSSYPMLRSSPDATPGAWGPVLRVRPESGVVLGERGALARITGHFDDPAAQTCSTHVPDDVRELNPDVTASISPEGSVYGCRLQFVVDDVEVLDFIPLPTHAPQG